MPSKSKSQQRLFQAAEHGASFPMAQKLQQGMSKDQMHDFAVGSEKGKPEHVKKEEHHGRHKTSEHSPHGRKPSMRGGF